MYLVGVDVGGTFTDVVLANTEGERTFVHKVATTPEDPAQGVMRGIRELCERHGLAPASIDHVYHGTTIATNAVLEYKGAETGVITTAGYRDILHIGRHQRPQHYSIMQEIPWQDRPLAKRRHRKVVRERLIPPQGAVLVPLNEEDVRAAARALKAEGISAIAICFLFSYLNPVHEERAKAIIAEECPEAFICTSAAVSPQFREFERFTTAAMNAFIGPAVGTYVANLAAGLAHSGLKADLRIMRSNGGVATPEMVAEKPVLTLLSGPAAGVLGGAWAGALSGRQSVITFDVGGTSADIGVVTEGRFGEATARDTWIAGYPVMVPMIDLHTIGAGGGSIAAIDPGGGFQVGPRSAGARPGPAAYGLGGRAPTVTDANLVLGRLDKDSFLGGAMALDEAAARDVVGEFADRLGISPLEAAEGIVTVLNSNMANAIRSRTVQKGIDPRDYVLVAFGGAGPLHGAEVAQMLSIPEIIVPPHPGITSAVGLLTTEIKYDAVRTEFQVSSQLDLERLDRDYATMEAEIRGQFARDGIAPASARFERFGDLRYVGQGYELRIAVPGGALSPAALEEVFGRFHRQHEAEYGHAFPTSPVEIVNILAIGIGPVPKIGRPAAPAGGSLAGALRKTDRTVFRVDGRLAEWDTRFFERARLPVGEPIAGPTIILQADSTTVVPPGVEACADPHGNLVLALPRGAP
ncbi:MAG: hydantoinase/oxoprolinase family protein [Alphaproteobacteria bacterium]|nr:hydantoinase/oxoprolinase family protein [Alphaproteobacteria bacterium]